jgi:hypothetical protein
LAAANADCGLSTDTNALSRATSSAQNALFDRRADAAELDLLVLLLHAVEGDGERAHDGDAKGEHGARAAFAVSHARHHAPIVTPLAPPSIARSSEIRGPRATNRFAPGQVAHDRQGRRRAMMLR